MKRNTLALLIILLLLAALGSGPVPSAAAQAQEPELKPALIEQTMPEISLPLYQGGELSLSSLHGKNIVVIVPRVWAAPNYYCTICDYQYVNLADIDKAEPFLKKHNAQIVYLFPFGKEDVAKWLASLPEQMDKIKATKYPADPSKLDEKGKSRMERWRKFFPKDFTFKPDNVPTPFPIMLDPDRKVTKSLGVFSTNWQGGQVDQGIPSVFIIDAKGVLMFKYISQSTVDRPSPEYLAKILDMINAR
jgi:peroxiredoxin